MAPFFKSKHRYAESGDCAKLGVYFCRLVNPTKIKLQFALGAQAFMSAICFGSAGIHACGLPAKAG
jgi:hypothetical protein